MPTLRQDAVASNVLLVALDIEARSAAASKDLHRLFPNLVDAESAPDDATGAVARKDEKRSQMAAGTAKGGSGKEVEVVDVKQERFSQTMLS